MFHQAIAALRVYKDAEKEFIENFADNHATSENTAQGG